MKRFLKLVILVPVGILLIVFAVANRGGVTLSLDPFDATAPAIALRLPIFVVIFLALAIGIVIGGVAAWLRQSKWRRLARSSQAEMARRRSSADYGSPPPGIALGPPLQSR